MLIFDSSISSANASALEDSYYMQLMSISNGSTTSDNCTQCLTGAALMHTAAVNLPVENFVNLAIRVYEKGIGDFPSDTDNNQV